LKICYLTISDINYFCHVKVLFNSLLIQGCEELYWGHVENNFIHLKRITANEIFLVKPNAVSISKKDSIVEVCTRYRPLLLEHVFDISNCDIGCYIDPDIYVYSSLEDLLDPVATVWITPHLIVDDLMASNNSIVHEEGISQAYSLQRWGSFNMGIYFVRNSISGRRFLKCFQAMLDRSCSMESLYSFVDQKWMDVLVSMFYSQIKVLSHPGINLSYWNLPFRTLTQNGDQFFVNNKILKAIHFSGVGVQNINCNYGPEPLIKILITNYQAKLITNISHTLPKTTSYSFGKILHYLMQLLRKIMFFILAKTESR
jgi:hypothetical protein